MSTRADLERDPRATLPDTESTLDLPQDLAAKGHQGSTQASEPELGETGETGEMGGDIEGARLFALVRSRIFSRHATLRIGRYRIVRRLGAGAMGEVHLAIDEQLDRPVAIKFVHAHLANERFTQRLRVEARALARLAHPNVVHVYEVGEHEGRVYLAMEYVQGQSLREWVGGGESAQGWAQVLAIFMDAGRGLAAAHSAGVVHRDFKPENVLCGADGRVAVADFGLAAVDDQPDVLAGGGGAGGDGGQGIQATLDSVSVTRSRTLPRTMDLGRHPALVSRTGEVKGTPAYMPPEQFRGQSDARADQFSLCVSLYEALWGQRPFARRTLAQMLEGDVDWRPLQPSGPVPKWIWPIIRRGLAVDPDDRWASVDELLAAFERGLSARRRRLRLLGSGVVALAVGLLGVASGASVAWWSEDPRVDDCANIERELDDTWGQARRTKLGQVLASAAASSGAAWLVDSEAPIVAGLDRWRSGWLTSRAQLCHARAGGDPVVLDRQGTCLERHRRSTQALVDLMLAEAVELDTLRQAPRAVLDLDEPRACAREARQGGPPEPAEVIAADVQQVRRELSVIEAELLIAHHETALVKAEQLATRVAELDYPPLSAELANTRGRVLLGVGRSAEGLEALEQAADLGEGAHHDRVVADSWRRMAMSAATKHPDLQAGRGWLRRADAAGTRVGLDELGAARLEFVRGNLDLLDHQVDAAIESLEPALVVFEDHQDLMFAAHTATSLGVAALDRSGSGDRDRALHEFRRALELLERVHGPRHPDVALAAYNLGQISLEAGDLELAQAMLERAVQIWTHADELELRNLGRAQLVLGQLAFGERRHQDTLEHARAAADAFERSALPIDQAEAASLAAMALYYLGQHERSITAYGLAIQGYTAAYGASDLYVGYFRVGLGWALLAAGRAADARVEFESALAVIEAKGGASEQAVDARFGLISVDIVDSRLESARAQLAGLEADLEVGLAGMELVELELFRGLLALRRDPPDHAAGASALGRARVQAKAVGSGDATLAILLDSLGATPDERRLAGE